MTGLPEHIADLSPEKRALLERRLMAMGLLTPSGANIPSRDRSAPCELSFAQQRLWFLDQLEPDNCVYNIAKAVRLRGVLQVEALRRALDAVVGRHAALRTTVVPVGDAPVQVVADRWAVALPTIDLSAAAEAGRETELTRVLCAEARRPFNLAADLMLRALLVRLGAREHVLLLTMHHIASDAWSMGILTRELSVFYTALVEARSQSLPPLPIQYADYALWQRRSLQGDTLQEQLAYWTAALKGAPPVLELPVDRPRPPVQSFKGARASVTLPNSLRDDLKALGSRERATLFMTLLAAFDVLLARYTGQDDIVVGAPIANRTRAESAPLIGFFANTLALRGDLSGDPSFREFLGRVRAMALDAYDHQDLPFEKLVEELRPERNLSWTPVVQVMFTLQDPDQPGLELPGLSVSPVAVDMGTAKFDLTASVTEMPQGLRVALTYNTDLYEPATIQRMLGHYEIVLRGIVADPGQRVSRLPVLTEAERKQLLIEWNATQMPFPESACIHELFEAQAARTPEAVAVTYEGRSLTYCGLNQRANQLAHYLRKRGIGPDILVGLCCDRSLDMIVGLLGILKAGGAYVPLDPADPPERLAFMQQEAGMSVVVTQQHRLHTLPSPGAVCLDTDWKAVAQEDTSNPPPRATADKLCYVIYTSGSTGRPKGVMITHRAVSNLMTWLQATFPMNEADVVLQKTPATFDASVPEFFAPLLVGARLVMARPEGHRDSRYLIETICAERVSRVKLVPSLLQALAEEPDLEKCTSLRHVTCGGEALPRGILERFRARLNVELVNLYGPTEATVDATSWVCGQNASSDSDIVPIGRPIGNTQAYVLDEHQLPVPIGVPGELYIGGAGLARGYLGHPELTAERFVPNPFSAEAGARLYRTGDRARYLPDGNLEYFGRLDHQVKLRGFRIELGEIEAALREHPEVREAVVILREDPPQGKRLVAYLVPRHDAGPGADTLRQFVQRRLPEYMVPSAFVPLSALPLMPSGKVDRNRLPAPDPARPAGEHVAPRDAMERQLVQIWEDILGVHPVGVTDSFFELGGHSLLAGRLLARVRERFQVDVTLRSFFDAPTIAGVATAIVSKLAERAKPDAVARALDELRGLSSEDAQRLLDDAEGGATI